jgi:hypothetical protein
MHLYRNTEPNAELLEFKCVEFSETCCTTSFSGAAALAVGWGRLEVWFWS